MAAVSARLRFGAVASSRIPRYWHGDTVVVWCDFFQTDAPATLVDASEVSAHVYLPGGTLLEPALEAVEAAPGTWYVTIPAEYAGTYTVEMVCEEPDIARDVRTFTVREREEGTAPPTASPVTSVNGQTGAVVITPGSIGAEESDPAPAFSTARFDASGYLIWLFAGQSNAVGRGAIDALYDINDARVWQWDNASASATYRTIVAGADPVRGRDGINTGNVGPAAAMLRQLALGVPPGNRLLIVSAAVGGTTIAQWGAPAGAYYTAAIDAANRAIVAAQAELPGSTFGGIFWCQGEADSQEDAELTEADYAAALDATLAGLRAGITGASTAPVIIASMTPEWQAGTLRFVARAHRDTPRRVTGTAYIHGPAGVAQDTGSVHYNGAGIREVARRAAAAVPRAIANTGGAIPSAPTVASVTVQGRSAALVELTPPRSRVTNYAWQYNANAAGWTAFSRFEASVDYRLLVTGITAGASVTFRAAAINDAGQGAWSSASSAVTLAGSVAVPGQPFGIRLSSVADTTATVSWYPPEEGDTWTAYSVEWRYAQIAGFDPGPWVEAAASASALSANLTGLMSGTELQFRVVASNTAGDGEASLIVNETTTGAGVAPGAFSTITEGTHGVRTLVFIVGPPSSGGAPTSVATRYRESGDVTWLDGPSSTSNTVSIGGLDPETEYEVQLAGVNAAGQGPWSDTQAATTAAVTYMLDALGLSSSGAFSLRKLRSAYAGSAIRVRRSSDNAEADIGFDVAGILDTAALLTHCGVGSGYVTTFYDQSGNSRNLTQATTGRQPRIVDAGAVEDLANGAPTIRFAPAGTGSGTDLRRTAGGLVTASTNFGLFMVMEQQRSGTPAGALIGQVNANAFAMLLGTAAGTGFRWIKGGGDATGGQTAIAGTLPVSQVNTIATNYVHTGSTGDIWINGTNTNDGVTWSGATQNATQLALGDYPGASGSWVWTGYCSELLFFDGQTLSDATIGDLRESAQGAWGAV